MLRIWLTKLSAIQDYNMLKRYGYNTASIDDSEIVDLWDKVNNAQLKIDEGNFIYKPKYVEDSLHQALALQFFRELYDKDSIITELDYLLDLVTYKKGNKDLRYAQAVVDRKNDIGSTEIYSICVEKYKDILTADLLVHEFSHAIYSAPIEFLYNETIAMTFEKIFASLNHLDLEILNSISSIRSSYYDGDLEVKEDTIKDKIKYMEKLYSKTYLIGYITSLYLIEKYKDDPISFRSLINKNRYNINAAKEILKYYGFNFKSNEVDSLLDKDIQKVKKRMYS